jgi:ribonuclease VapC
VIVDTSALVAILTGEESGPRLLEAMMAADRVNISAATLLEASIVLDSRTSPQQRRRLDDLLRLVGIEIVPFDASQYEAARTAYQDFGRGSGHAAHLNFGDCFAYALARVTGEPLLFQGEDFTAAGVVSALDRD